jgi:hypothetical protein
MSSGSHILALLSKHWWLNCSTFALQSAFAQTLEHFTKLPKHTYTRSEEGDVTSLLNSICNFDFVVTIVIVQMCLAFKKGLICSAV